MLIYVAMLNFLGVQRVHIDTLLESNIQCYCNPAVECQSILVTIV